MQNPVYRKPDGYFCEDCGKTIEDTDIEFHSDCDAFLCAECYDRETNNSVDQKYYEQNFLTNQ